MLFHNVNIFKYYESFPQEFHLYANPVHQKIRYLYVFGIIEIKPNLKAKLKMVTFEHKFRDLIKLVKNLETK